MNRLIIVNALIEAVKEVSPFANEHLASMGDKEALESSFVSLGINSVDYTQVVHEVGNRLGIGCSLDEFACAVSLEKFVEIISGLRSDT